MVSASVLVVGRPGPLRTGLGVLVSALSLEMRSADDAESMFEALAKHQPSLILLDLEPLAAETARVLQQLKTGWPGVQLVALADDEQQCRLAHAASTDAVLLKGMPAGQLADVIQGLLAGHGGGLAPGTAVTADE